MHGVEIQAAAEMLAKHLGVKLLTTSSGLLWQFHKWHNNVCKKVSGESSADKLDEIRKEKCLQLRQLYNADMLLQASPKNTLTSHGEKKVPDWKIRKEQV